MFQYTAISLLILSIGLSGCTKKRDFGNTLRVAVREKFRSMDPAKGSDHYSGIMIRRTYEGLLQYNYLKRPYVLEPLLADGMPQVSKDRLTFIFKIRKDAKFHDDKGFTKTAGKGRGVVAKDFVYSFMRLADPKLASDGWWIFDKKIVGLNEWREAALKAGKADFDAAVEGLKIIDDYTLQIKLTKANTTFMHVLSMPYANVVAREIVEFYGDELRQHPVGTGPFMLESLSPNQAIWVRNPVFHGENYPTEGEASDKANGLLADAGKPIPFVDKIIDDIIIEDQPAWLNFMQGNHDYLMKIPKDNQTAVFDANHQIKKEILDKGIGVHLVPAADFVYVGFNMEDPILGGEKGKYLRLAISHAYDSSVAIEKFYLGLAKKAESPIPPGVAGYDESYKAPSREFNIEKAKGLLAKAGHPEGKDLPELIYETLSSTTYRQIAEYFQMSLAKIGLKVKVNVNTWPELLEKIRKKRGQVFGISWLYDYPDAENGWQLLYGPNESPGSNEANYKNPKFDAFYEKITSINDGPERFAIFKQMKKIFEDDVPWLLNVHRMEMRMTNPWAKNFKLHLFTHNVEKYMRIDTEARKKALE